MPQFTQSPVAQRELLEIFYEIGRHNLSAADRLVERFDEVFHRLASHPEMGGCVSTRRRNVRQFPVGNYLIYYRPISDGVEILHVWHGARDKQPRF